MTDKEKKYDTEALITFLEKTKNGDYVEIDQQVLKNGYLYVKEKRLGYNEPFLNDVWRDTYAE